MNITYGEVFPGSNRGAASGCEVESATFHPATEALVPVTSAPRSGIRARVDELKSRGMSKLHGMQRTVSHRSSVMKSSLQRSMTDARTSLRTGVDGQMTKMQSSMQSNPMKWAGIAAGSGLAIGLVGRFLQWRNSQAQRMPQLVVIERAC